jgi:catechol 2,3-dioxygenase-like lactoylglutathione lyase family enzyme
MSARMNESGTVTRRDRFGIHSIGEFVLAVPDLQAAERYYGTFGLKMESAGNALALKTPGDGYRWGRIIAGPKKQLHHITFHCFEEDLPRFRAHLGANRVDAVAPPPGVPDNGLWFHDHDGLLVEIRPGPKTSPNAKTAIPAALDASGVRCAPYRRDTAPAAPRRLSHILRFTPNVDRAIDFYSRVLGLGLSDRSGDGIAFLHGIHGSDHHLMAFVKSEYPGLHHFSWDMPTVDSVGLGAMGLMDKGYTQGWGVGRHVLGSNYFYYSRDPWGSYCEYSCGIDFVPADARWEGLDHPAEESFYLWGPQVPPEFILNTEAPNS